MSWMAQAHSELISLKEHFSQHFLHLIGFSNKWQNFLNCSGLPSWLLCLIDTRLLQVRAASVRMRMPCLLGLDVPRMYVCFSGRVINTSFFNLLKHKIDLQTSDWSVIKGNLVHGGTWYNYTFSICRKDNSVLNVKLNFYCKMYF